MTSWTILTIPKKDFRDESTLMSDEEQSIGTPTTRTRHLVSHSPRAITSFAFLNSKGKVTAPVIGASGSIAVVGTVTSLLHSTALLVQCGHWDSTSRDLNSYCVPMRLSVTKVEASNSDDYRGGEKAVWLNTNGYRYVCQQPDPQYERLWNLALDRAFGGQVMIYRDIDALQEKPEWWPNDLLALWIKFRVTAYDENTQPPLLLEYNRQRLKPCDFRTLQPGSCLNDEVVNFYMEIVRQRPDCYVFNTFFYMKVNRYEHVKAWTKNIDIFTIATIFIPIHVHRNHWICSIIRPKIMQIEIYDSLKGEHTDVYLALRSYLVHELREKKKASSRDTDWIYYANPNSPQQSGYVDCGVFVCQYIDCVSRGCTADFSQAQITSLRNNMVNEILDAGLTVQRSTA